MTFIEFLEALSRAIDDCQKLPLLPQFHEHWYLQELEPEQWMLDMKVEAMVPTLLANLK
jgi:hypothetical protein